MHEKRIDLMCPSPREDLAATKEQVRRRAINQMCIISNFWGTIDHFSEHMESLKSFERIRQFIFQMSEISDHERVACESSGVNYAFNFIFWAVKVLQGPRIWLEVLSRAKIGHYEADDEATKEDANEDRFMHISKGPNNYNGSLRDIYVVLDQWITD